MKSFLKISAIFFGIIILTILNMGISYIFPYPWSKINIIIAVLIILIMWWESGFIVWIAFACFFLLELFAITPFGVVLFSSTISILFVYWMYFNIFTNRSWYTAIALSVLVVFIYRVLYLLVLFLISIFTGEEFLLNVSFYLILFWELLLTTVLVVLGFIFLSLVTKRKNIKQNNLFLSINN